MPYNSEKQHVHEVTDKPAIGLRWIIIFILFATYVVVFYIMNSFGVLIVAMVNVTSHSNTNDTRNADACVSINEVDTGNFSSEPDKEIAEGEYLWTTLEQGFILGSYFWGFLISKLILSRIWEKVGQRTSISLGITIMGILCIFSPLCATIGPYALSFNRFLIGVCAGPITSNTQSLISAWAPRNELSSMCTTAESGIVVGNMLGFFTSGAMIKKFGWRSVFYFEGVLALFTLPLWFIFVRNSPFQHPWLTSYEENLLIENKIIKTKKRVPHKKILKSPFVYLIVYCQFAQMWTDTVLIIEGPSFFKYKLGFHLENVGYIIGITNSLSLVWIISSGRISDLLINKKVFSKTNARKMFHLIGTGGEGLLLIIISLAGCSFDVVMILWILVFALGSSVFASYRLSLIDIAPNFTVIVGSFMALGNLGNALAPLVVSVLLEKGMGWSLAFYLTAAIDFLSLILYTTFMTSKAQPWNFIEEEEGDEVKLKTESEKKPLQ